MDACSCSLLLLLMFFISECYDSRVVSCKIHIYSKPPMFSHGGDYCNNQPLTTGELYRHIATCKAKRYSSACYTVRSKLYWNGGILQCLNVGGVTTSCFCMYTVMLESVSGTTTHVCSSERAMKSKVRMIKSLSP